MVYLIKNKAKMKKITFILFTVLLFSCAVHQSNAQESPEYVQNQMIVILNDEFDFSKIDWQQSILGNAYLDQLNQQHQIQKIQPLGIVEKTKTLLFIFPEGFDAQSVLSEYQAQPIIESVELNYIAKGGGQKMELSQLTTFANDTYLQSRQWGLINDGTFSVSSQPFNTTYDADVDMELAWDIETGDPNLIIAVPDSGIRMSHEDINARIWNKIDIEPIDGVDNDGNGLIDDYQGWDYVNNDNDPSDDLGHGTNCAGILGTTSNNTLGYTGVNWNSKVMTLKVLNQNNSGSYYNMINSIYYAVDNGAKVISMSIGGTANSNAMSNALDYANENNVVFVCCMMNTDNNTVYYPAKFAQYKDNVIAVGSTNSNDYRSSPFFWDSTSGSNFGDHITVVAPGNYIYGIGNASDYSYNTFWGGTSQATPLVAGIASLLLSHSPNLSPLQVKQLIQNSAEDQVGDPSEDVQGWDPYMGHGRVNAFNALQTLEVEDIAEDNTHDLKVRNPVKQNILQIVNSNENIGEVLISIHSLEGKFISKVKKDLNLGENIIPIHIPSGSYLVTVKDIRYQKTFKIIVE